MRPEMGKSKLNRKLYTITKEADLVMIRKIIDGVLLPLKSYNTKTNSWIKYTKYYCPKYILEEAIDAYVDV